MGSMSPVSANLARLDLHGRCDGDRRHERPGDGAELDVCRQDTFDGIALLLVGELETVGHVDPFEDQDLVFFLDLAFGDSDETISC